MRNLRVHLIILFLASLVAGTNAAAWQDMPSLTSSNVSDIIQDKYGFIWIGTDNGLNRYDGWTNVTYACDRNDSTSLKSNYVESLLTDTSGDLWIGTGGGIQKYQPGSNKFANVTFPDGIHPSVRSTIQTEPGKLMAVTSGYGAFTIDTKTMKASKNEPLDELIGSKYAHIIRQDGLNRIWIGCGGDNRILAVDKNLRKLYSDRLPSRIVDIEHDGQNNIWTATDTYLYRWDAKLSRFVRLDNYAIGNIKALTRTKNGDLLVITLEDGVFIVNPKDNTLHELKQYSGIKHDGIINLYEDHSGNIWCATAQKGLTMHADKESFFRFVSIPTSPSRKIECLFEDKASGAVSAALSDGTIMTFDSALNLIGNRSVPGRLTATYTNQEGKIFAGYADGRLFGSDGNQMSLIHNFDNHTIETIARDAKGRYYIGLSGDGFLTSKDLTNWIKINESTPMATPQRLGNNWINRIMPTSTGKIWIGHSNGLDIYDPERNSFSDEEWLKSLRAHIVYAIKEARDGSMWIGTNYGLYHFLLKEQRLESFSTAEGIGGNIICGLAESNNGDIWCTTNNGITRIRQADGKIISYHSDSGLEDREFRKKILLHGPDEKIYAAGMNGVTSFQPDAIKDLEPARTPMLTGLHIASRNDRKPEIKYAEAGDGYSATIKLKHFQNTFTLDFSNFDYGNQGNVEFEYRIPQLEKEWQKNAPGDNRVICNYMEPGRYILEVRAEENGLASPITSILIEILPPWYQTIWAKAIYILIALLMAAGIFHLIRRNRLQHHKEEMAEEKFKMLYNFAHELRSPVTLITSPLTAIIKEEKDERKAEIFRMIQRNGYRITNLVNQMLDIRRIEKGQLKLSYRETDLEEYLRLITEDFRLQAQSRGITLTFTSTDGNIRAYVDTDNFDKVIVNLISNALKYTPQGGSIDIILSNATETDGKQYARVEVKDTGSGIKPEDLGHIFERFYQGNQKKKGFGIGLNLTKMLVEMHHGKITAANRSDRSGAIFEILIPTGRKHLKDKEIAVAEEGHESNILTDRHIEAKESIALPSDQTAERGSRQHRILIVDDDEEIRNYLKRELGKTYRTSTASDGDEAYRIAQDTETDLIISDINMPNTDGFDLLRMIRANADLAHIPVMLLTTSEDFETRMTGWEKGADAYLTKPFRIEEMRKICTSLISGRIRLKGRFSNGEKAEEKINKVEVKGNDELLLERITKAVNENLGNSEFGVEELAEAVGLSRVHLHRKMKALVGLPPRDFLKSVRLKQAAELLKKNNTNISQIGYMVGFSSPSQFSDSFRKYFGVSPSEYISRGNTEKNANEEPQNEE